MKHEEPATWIACLTPPGQAALATLGLYGPRAWETLRLLFRLRSGGELPQTPVIGRFWLGRLGSEIADEVVVVVKRIEPLPLLEVHGHGGREVVRFLVDLFREQGVQLCGWEDFLRRTDGDALRVEATIALTQATTLRTASVLLDQQQGALSFALEAILQSLERGESTTAAERLHALLRYASLGRHLTQPWRLVVAGAPNVGKSSLVNALAGYQRSIVSATPGTTRDVVTVQLALDGWPFELADTAGMRSGAEALEEQGILRARETVAEADLCLWILDASAPPVWPEQKSASLLYVINKSDLPCVWSAEREAETLRVSAKTGEGLAELCAALVAHLVPDPPPLGAAIPFAPRLASKLAEIQRLLTAGDNGEARRLMAALRVSGGQNS